MQTHQIINKFDKYLKQTIGAAENTRHQYIRYVVQQFLRERFSTVSQVELSKSLRYQARDSVLAFFESL